MNSNSKRKSSLSLFGNLSLLMALESKGNMVNYDYQQNTAEITFATEAEFNNFKSFLELTSAITV